MSALAFSELLSQYRSLAHSEHDKGARFERLMQAFLRTAPMYAGRFALVWLWNEFPYRDQFGGKDTGIDLVARTPEGEYWAVQCKCFAETAHIDKPAVDSFLATSSKHFQDEQGKAGFVQRLWISTTNKWGAEAENTIKNQEPPFTRLNLSDLEQAPVDWAALDQGISGTAARQPRKTLRPHQTKALEAFRAHFAAGWTRGKLIMACGTGKTFTALKIAEEVSSGKGLILFLAPSIALVGQTLREWTAEAAVPIRAICVCSDPKVSVSRVKNDDASGYSVADLALPASTHTPDIVDQLNRAAQAEGMTVVFSTYQSISSVEAAVNEAGLVFDLVICDEAHRTTGVTLKGEEAKPFVRVHDAEFPARRRLYMTATPRLYAEKSKQQAKDAEALLCSMDDESLYGPEVYRIGFGEAVDRDLLSDYKVLVFTLSEQEIPVELQKAITNKDKEIDTNDAGKLIGCMKALSKRMLLDDFLLKEIDQEPMRKAVAFCKTIKVSKKIASIFNEYCYSYHQSLSEKESAEIVRVSVDHVDGTMPATVRDEKLFWLNKVKAEGNNCHILTNVKCLSEGVDVPSLDAVIFLSEKNSPIDVVQSVGRVMRKAPGKKYGYIIIPVLVAPNVKPEDALDKNAQFAVVWSVLNALRAHDDRFDAHINKIDLKRGAGAGKESNILVGGSPSDDTDSATGGTDGTEGLGSGQVEKELQLFLPFNQPELQSAIYARMVQKVGNKRYWEQWAADVAIIAQNYIARITRMVEQEGPHQDAFNTFLEDLRKNINPSVTAAEVVEMLAQHLITKPVFETMFANYSFASSNPVSCSLQKMLDILEEQALEKDTEHLNRFYESVKNRASSFKNAADRQKAILELYDKFFRTAFPKTVEKLGIVYTPVEIVDFINRSADWVLQQEFGRGLADENVHILDPFTGTGTFMVRLIQSGLIPKEALARKYQKELHANEIVLLAYYIASINIENAYHDTQGEETEFVPFPGICLTDTFQLGEEEYMPTPSLPQNSERVKEQREAPIRVIIGNPPYSVGQKSANDNARNQRYPRLERRIAGTYASGSTATLSRSLYDSYIKAFRWASDRLGADGGVIAFVTNGYWLDSNAMDGFRKCLQREFNRIYVLNLRGGIRGKMGDAAKREGGNVFNIMTQVAVTVLVKKSSTAGLAQIFYHDIGDYLSREDKLRIVTEKGNIGGMDLSEILPNEHEDWLNKRNKIFISFFQLADKNRKQSSNFIFNPLYSLGINSSRDVWVYNFSERKLINNIQYTINYFNKLCTIKISTENLVHDSKKFSWSRRTQNFLKSSSCLKVENGQIIHCIYRPFCKENIYFSSELNDFVGQIPKLFPTPNHRNYLICVSSPGGRRADFSPFIIDCVPDYHLHSDGTQCFPLYYYEEDGKNQLSLLDKLKKQHTKKDSIPDFTLGEATLNFPLASVEGEKNKQVPLLDKSETTYTRKDGITDFILSECRLKYGEQVTKEDIFYYVYGLLHSPEYRETFAADLKKMLPRLPLVDKTDDFWAFSKAGRKLADLHLRYEEQVPCPEVQVEGTEHEDFIVQKMRFLKKGDKSAIQYNDKIKVTNIPLEAYEYVVNGRSAIEWIMDRYQIKTDKASGITNDPNDWAREHEKPRYILDLLLSIVTVSLETMKIVQELPKLDFQS